VRSPELLRGSGGCVEQDWVLGDGKEGRDVVLALASSTRLRQLALCNINITTVHTPTLLGAALPSLTALQVLDLSCNHLGAAGAHSLAAGLGQLPALTELNLRATALHDAGALELARALVSMASLMSLILRNTQLHVQGASMLAAALPSLTALEALDLGNNRRV
jgi:Ran GTPase-activating protein (RanGAP) involved in mRNA processing and transport